MSTNIKWVVGIAGPKADELSEVMLHWVDRYTDDSGRAEMQFDAEPHDVDRLRTLMAELKAGLKSLPVVFFRSWLDSWSVASSDVSFALSPLNAPRIIAGPEGPLAFVLERDFATLLDARPRVKRLGAYQKQKEDRWACNAFWDAIEALNAVPLPKLVVCFDECLGGSRCEADILRGCQEGPAGETAASLNTSE